MDAPIQSQVRRFREEAKLSQAAMAAALDVTPSHVSKVENSRTGVSLDVIERYLKACGCRLVIVPLEPTDESLEQLTVTLDAKHRGILLVLAQVLPQLPEILTDELERQISSWHARFVGDSD